MFITNLWTSLVDEPNFRPHIVGPLSPTWPFHSLREAIEQNPSNPTYLIRGKPAADDLMCSIHAHQEKECRYMHAPLAHDTGLVTEVVITGLVTEVAITGLVTEVAITRQRANHVYRFDIVSNIASIVSVISVIRMSRRRRISR
jgi:hypothetical protein